MRALQLLQTTAFRWTLGSAAIVALSLTVMGGFFYWQTVGYLRQRTETSLVLESQSLAGEGRRRVLVARIEKALAVDPLGIKAYGLFLPSGERLAGDIERLPDPLPPPDRPAEVTVEWSRPARAGAVQVRAVSTVLPDGSILFLGRAAGDLVEIDEIVTRAMVLAVIPAAMLALVGGAVLSLGTLRRVEAVRRACSLIMEGQFHRRLPVRRRGDEFDRLAEMVNLMLDEIERLVTEVKGAGDAIAHDLRTPLTRMRARLDRALDPGAHHAPVPEVLQKSIADLDQMLSTVTAILRLAEVEQGRRESGFGPVDLDDVIDAVAELYAPIADDKEIRLDVVREHVEPIRGDRDLVFEAVANLVDNAVKFAPRGGRVGIELRMGPGGPVIRVWDTGPGILPSQRDAVTRRFYRLDPSRHLPGTGLGLSLVAAIVRLHGFDLTIGSGTAGGCDIVLQCREPRRAESEPSGGVIGRTMAMAEGR